ncbi:unnamed protein product [Hermetia illucens]|uniref:Uncharacterized protein n=1 Tax=Hermetia illucens TaxID=343691 RepID=A0A7R8V677_HERIL|nr:unnamed protein product [Hermetia illucens]
MEQSNFFKGERSYRKDVAARKTTWYLQKKRETSEALTLKANHRMVLVLLKADNPYFGLEEEIEDNVGAIKTMIESDQPQWQHKSPTENIGAINIGGNAKMAKKSRHQKLLTAHHTSFLINCRN